MEAEEVEVELFNAAADRLNALVDPELEPASAPKFATCPDCGGKMAQSLSGTMKFCPWCGHLEA